MLKSLSVLSFPMLEIDLENCDKPDGRREYCQVCKQGYRNFMGRCRPFDAGCVQYLTDECGACAFGFRLSKGICY
jgi:hypothetical protein